jgi:hypothetical protein
MTPSRKSETLGLARGRAAAQVTNRPDDTPGLRRRDDMVLLLKQIGDVTETVEDAAGAKYLTINGAHNAGFRIVVVVANDGRVGWSLV